MKTKCDRTGNKIEKRHMRRTDAARTHKNIFRYFLDMDLLYKKEIKNKKKVGIFTSSSPLTFSRSGEQAVTHRHKDR